MFGENTFRVKDTINLDDQQITAGVYVPYGRSPIGRTIYRNINNNQTVSLGKYDLKRLKEKIDKGYGES